MNFPHRQDTADLATRSAGGRDPQPDTAQSSPADAEKSVRLLPDKAGMVLEFPASGAAGGSRGEQQCRARFAARLQRLEIARSRVTAPTEQLEWRPVSGGLAAEHPGAVQERYLLAGGRVEQIFTIARRPAGNGELSLVLAAETDLTGPVVRRPRAPRGWTSMRRYRDALLFTDRRRPGTIAYYGARAIDATGNIEEIAPEWRPGTIVLRVSAAFMATALFPLVIDPWIELAGSAPREAGVSHGSGATEQPVVAVDASERPVVAWRQYTSGADQIFLKAWSGEAWNELGGSATGGLAAGDADRAEDPTLAVDSRGYPVVAWSETDLGAARIQVRRWDGAAWEDLASSASWGARAIIAMSRTPAVAVDGEDRPLVAWSEDAGGNMEIYVRRWNGATWEELGGSATGGGISSTAGSSTAPALAVDAGGAIFVSWDESDGGGGHVYLKRWDGASWEELAGSASGAGVGPGSAAAYQSTTSCDASGAPVVAWVDYGAGAGQAYLLRYNGASWEELAGSASGGGVSGAPWGANDMAMTAGSGAGGPTVAWSEDVDGTEQIHARQWDGTSWLELGGSATGGGISNTTEGSYAPALAHDRTGRPVVAWTTEWGSYTRTFLARWNGAAWQAVGPSEPGQGVSGGGRARGGTMAVAPDDRPILAWRVDAGGVNSVHLRQWDGVEWAELAGSATSGGISGGVTHAYEPTVAAGRAGDPFVAWASTPGAVSQIYLKTFAAGTWQELGGSAMGGGVSATSGDAYSPALAIDGDERPWVAWEDHGSGNSEIYVKRWDGAAWVELAGSASGGGISATASASTAPALAVDAAGSAIVVWQEEEVAGVGEIRARVWSGTAWEELGGSASGGGISATGFASAAPAVALDAAGRAFVAWTETVGGDEEIYLRWWDGASWAELGGSASGGGISAAAGWSGEASLVLDGEGLPVVSWSQEWLNGSVTEFDIHLRRWDGASWVEIDGSATGGGISATMSRGPGVGGGASFASTVGLLSDGGPAVAWLDEMPMSLGAAVYFRAHHLLPDPHARAGQFEADGITVIPLGGATGSAAIVFKGAYPQASAGDGVRMEIEVAAAASSFAGTVSAASPAGAAGVPVTVSLGGLAEGGYQWQARAVDALGFSGAWAAFGANPAGESDFTVDLTAPPATALMAPANGAAITDPTPVLACAATADASGILLYGFAVAANADFAAPVVEGWSTSTALTPASPLADGSYYWRARALDAAGNAGDWSEIWTFAVDTAPPAAIVLTAPDDGAILATGQPELTWMAGVAPSGVALYEAQIGGTSAVSGEERLTPGTPLADDAYSWRVRWRNGAGQWADWSASRSFTIDTAPPARVELLAPAPGARLATSRPAFSWRSSEIDDAPAAHARYEIQVGDTPGFTIAELVAIRDEPRFTAAEPLSHGRHFWRVRERDRAGNWGDRSEERLLVVEVGSDGGLAVPLLAPAGTAALLAFAGAGSLLAPWRRVRTRRRRPESTAWSTASCAGCATRRPLTLPPPAAGGGTDSPPPASGRDGEGHCRAGGAWAVETGRRGMRRVVAALLPALVVLAPTLPAALTCPIPPDSCERELLECPGEAPPPIPCDPDGPGRDHPDDRVDAAALVAAARTAAGAASPAVAVLDAGTARSMIEVLGERFLVIRVAPGVAASEVPASALVVPSGALAQVGSSPAVVSMLQSYVDAGGTLVAMAQQRGADLAYLPVPGGSAPLDGFGWAEDQSCFAAAAEVGEWHPVLASVTANPVDIALDGYFSHLPTAGAVLLRRTTNGAPAVIAYPVGSGWVVATTTFSDWGAGFGLTTALERDLLAAAMRIGLLAAEVLELTPGAAGSVPLSVVNASATDAAHAVVLLSTPDGATRELSRSPLALPAGGATALAVDVPAASEVGAYEVRVLLADVDSDAIGLGGRAAFVRQTPPTPVAPADLGLSVQLDRENYAPYDRPVVTAVLMNRSAVPLALRCEYGLAHNDSSRTVIFDDTVSAGSTATATATGNPVRHQGWAILRCSQGGKYVGSASKGFYVTAEQLALAAFTDKNVYARGESIALDLELQNVGLSSFTGTLRYDIRGSQGAMLQSEDIPLVVAARTNETISRAVAAFAADAPLGPWTIEARATRTIGGAKLAWTARSVTLERGFAQLTLDPATSFAASPAAAVSIAPQRDRVVPADTLLVTAADGSGQQLLAYEEAIPALLPGQTHEATVAVPLGAGDFGTYEVTADLRDAADVPPATFRFVVAADAKVRFDQQSYVPGQPVAATVTVANAGDVDGVYAVTFAAPGASFAETGEVAAAAGAAGETAFAFALDPALPAGFDRSISVAVAPAAGGIGRTFASAIPADAPAIVPRLVAAAVAAGAPFAVELTNLGSTSGSYDASWTFYDAAGAEAASGARTGSLAAGAVETVALTPPSGCSPGTCFLLFRVARPGGHFFVEVTVQ